MKIDNSKMLVHLKLETNFTEIIDQTMEDEFEIASKKWNVYLNTDDHDIIMYHSRNQLRRKVSEMARLPWDMSDRMTIKVNSPQKGVEITLPSPKARTSTTKLLQTRDGWEIDDEKRDESVKLADFREHIQQCVLTWARTAVFYGVGSFTQ